MRTDYLDLFQLHSPPASVVESGEWVATLEDLKRQGKIRYYGVSCDRPDVALAALGRPGAAIQLPLNLLDRSAVPILDEARRQGVGVIARESLANGLLVKNLSTVDVREYSQSDEEALEKRARLDRYQRFAAEQGCTLTQLALQFVSGFEAVSVTLIGVSRIAQLEVLLSRGLRPPAPLDADAFERLG
jgi:aryl-alcohol dehydrogenase-like predicted oxidoreductase